MGTRHKRASRCQTCHLHLERCICALLPRLTLRTRVSLVLFRREVHKPTNTGAVALSALTNGQAFVWGDRDASLPREDIVPPGYRGLVLTHDGQPLTAELAAELRADGEALCLVVPDGSWRQASKMPRRIPALVGLPKVSLTGGAPTRYQLRDEPKAGGLSTWEAIARALGLLESLAVEAALMAPFDAFVGATLASRGQPAP